MFRLLMKYSGMFLGLSINKGVVLTYSCDKSKHISTANIRTRQHPIRISIQNYTSVANPQNLKMATTSDKNKHTLFAPNFIPEYEISSPK